MNALYPLHLDTTSETGPHDEDVTKDIQTADPLPGLGHLPPIVCGNHHHQPLDQPIEEEAAHSFILSKRMNGIAVERLYLPLKIKDICSTWAIKEVRLYFMVGILIFLLPLLTSGTDSRFFLVKSFTEDNIWQSQKDVSLLYFLSTYGSSSLVFRVTDLCFRESG